jgi:hypothetical protein
MYKILILFNIKILNLIKPFIKQFYNIDNKELKFEQYS